MTSQLVFMFISTFLFQNGCFSGYLSAPAFSISQFSFTCHLQLFGVRGYLFTEGYLDHSSENYSILQLSIILTLLFLSAFLFCTQNLLFKIRLSVNYTQRGRDVDVFYPLLYFENLKVSDALNIYDILSL